MAVQRLTAAYRSRPRPSSTPGAKASTVSPYYLDGERPVRLSVRVIIKLPRPVHRSARDLIGIVRFSRSTEARTAESFRRRSLKTEQRSQRRYATGEPGRRSREISLERR
jgi:hypothetical protein